MSHILITSGPTRQYLDPVRYLTNASSGRMGAALARAALDAGHKVTIVSGPVHIKYPPEAEVINVTSTEDMLNACLDVFPECDGLIAAAAPCDYKPDKVEKRKIHKTGDGFTLNLTETPDIVAWLSDVKTKQWIVAFALETDDLHIRALRKLEQKNCDLIVVNGPKSVDSFNTSLEVLDDSGQIVESFTGDKTQAAKKILAVIEKKFI